MDGESWIVVPNWDEFQHYRDRDPVWIKNYLRLLHDDAYRYASFHQRGVLHGIWLEYAASNRQLRDSTLALTRQLGQRVTRTTLDSLNHAGFIELSASRPLAPRYQAASPEKEGDKEKKPPYPLSEKREKPYTPRENVTAKDPVAAIEQLIKNGVIQDEVDLEAELRGYRLPDTAAQKLKALL